MKETEIYGALRMRENIEIEVLGMKQEIKLAWWHGMVGAVPMFKTKEDALDFVDGDEDKIFKMIAKGL